jgi:hypothetical protein
MPITEWFPRNALFCHAVASAASISEVGRA